MLQYAICPYCNKVKAVLDFLRVPYSSVEVDPISKAELKKVTTEYKKVPVMTMTTDGVVSVVSDSPVILSTLLERVATSSLDADTARRLKQLNVDDPDVARWVEWADRSLAVLLFPNICRSRSEALQAFSYVNDVETFAPARRVLLKYAGGLAMHYMAAPKMKKKYDIEDERASMYAATKEWTESALAVDGVARRFHGGDVVDLADVVVFGVLRGIDRTDAHADAMRESPALKSWYDAVAESLK